MTPRSLHRRAGGFTLLELLVVLVIVGIVVTFAFLSLGAEGRGEELRRETRRLATLLELAGEQAVVGARELAVAFEPDGYRFLVLANGAWQPLAGDELLRPRSLPPGLRLRVEVDDSPFERRDAAAEAAPRVFLLSSGEITPFTLTLRAETGGPVYRLYATPLGELRWEGPLEEGR